MPAVVIDTNVLLVADGQGGQMSEACQIECVNRLERVRSDEQVVLDHTWLILGEYKNKLNANGVPSAGNAFLKWLLQTQGKSVYWVTLTSKDSAQTKFDEFPLDEALEAAFDPADRKFVAAANACPECNCILEAADTKWLEWEANLAAHHISVEFLCRRELQEIHARKTI